MNVIRRSSLNFLKKYQHHIRQTTRLAVPVVIGQVGHVMMGVIDNAMVGRVGPVSLAGAAIGNSLFFTVMVVGIGMSYALSPLTAMAAGKQNTGEISTIFKQAFYINSITALLLLSVTYFGAYLISYLDQPDAVRELAIPYMQTLAFSAVPLMMFQHNRQFIEGLSIMKPAMYITLLANGVNAFANWVLIYGNLGFPEYGLAGAGYATFISRLFMAVVILAFIYKNKEFKKYSLNPFPVKFDKKQSMRILKLGSGSASQYFFEVTAFSLAAVMVGWLGAIQLASHQIAISVASVTYMITVGISSASAIRVGNYLGQGNLIETRTAGIAALILGASVMACFAVLLTLFHNFLPALYINDPDVIKQAGILLLFAALFQVFDGTQAVGLGVLRGIADVKIPTIITFVAYWAIGLPGAYLLGFTFSFGVEGIWAALSIALAVSAGLLTMRFLKMTKNPVFLQK